MRRPWRILAISLFALCLTLGGVVGDRVLALTDDARQVLRVYTELVTAAHDRYGSEVSYRDLVFSSIDGLLRTLDPHTSFLSPTAYANMRDRQKSTFFGLGILVGMRNGQLTVITPIEGTPASRMGIQAGDIIITIEDEPTESMNIDDAVRRLKGPKGTQVRIQIVRPGLADPLEMSITRDEIPQNTVRYVYMIDPRTGYLAISDFNRGTGREVAEAIEKLKSMGMKRLLLDLRYNGGGLLDQAIEVADQFLPAGAEIVMTRGRTRDSFQEFKASDRHPELGMPVVVLVNNGTASAAEILAGAIQDHDIGLILGTPTWGKGLVQTVYTLSYGAGIALTTAKYYTPSGRLIQRDFTSWFDYHTQANGNGAGLSPSEGARPGSDVFHTDLGREVYGGGGITPDIEVQLPEIPAFIQYLLSRNSFFDFAVAESAGHPVEDRDWQPDERLLARFSEWLSERDLATREEVDLALAEPEVRAAISRYLRAEFFNSAFGIEARYQALAAGDGQIQRALESFDEASELLARRRGLHEPAKEAPAAAL